MNRQRLIEIAEASCADIFREQQKIQVYAGDVLFTSVQLQIFASQILMEAAKKFEADCDEHCKGADTMITIKRYTPSYEYDTGLGMDECEQGDYCALEDVQALIEENKLLRQQLDEALRINNEQREDLHDAQSQWGKAVERNNEMAKEIERLKAELEVEKEEVISLGADIEAHENEEHKLTQRIAELENQNTQIKAGIDEYKAMYDSACEEKIKDLEQALRRLLDKTDNATVRALIDDVYFDEVYKALGEK